MKSIRALASVSRETIRGAIDAWPAEWAVRFGSVEFAGTVFFSLGLHGIEQLLFFFFLMKESTRGQ